MHKLLQERVWIYYTSVLLCCCWFFVFATLYSVQHRWFSILHLHAFQITFNCRFSYSFLLLVYLFLFFFIIAKVCSNFFLWKHKCCVRKCLRSWYFMTIYRSSLLSVSIYSLPTLLPYKWMNWKWTSKMVKRTERRKEQKKNYSLYRWNAS